MSKKYIVIASILLVVFLGLVGGYIVFSRANSGGSSESPISNLGSSLGSDSGYKFNETQTGYEDDSGYSFSYPQSLKIKDVTPSDEDYYSALELSKSGESIKIDITSGNVDPYKTDKSASIVGTTTLGGITANQYSKANRLVTVAIDQGVLYVISGPKDAGFWEDAQTKIISSFKFAGQTTTTQSSDSNTVYEEEVVE